MSINIQNFITRIFIAIIGIPIIFTCIYYGNMIFSFMMLVISILCVYEYFNMIKKYHIHNNLSMLMTIFFVILLNCNKLININILFYIILIMFVLFSIEIINGIFTLSIVRITLSFFGIFFIPMTLMYLVYIRNFPLYGMKMTFFIVIVNWIVDTAAYIIGSLFGTHKLTKNISPGKTLEGSLTGCIFGVLSSILLRTLFSMQQMLTINITIILGLTISIIGQFSDLAESIIKRDSNIKDSSNLIPGHGGVFDRFDSYIFVAPTIYYILKFYCNL